MEDKELKKNVAVIKTEVDQLEKVIHFGSDDCGVAETFKECGKGCVWNTGNNKKGREKIPDECLPFDNPRSLSTNITNIYDKIKKFLDRQLGYKNEASEKVFNYDPPDIIAGDTNITPGKSLSKSETEFLQKYTVSLDSKYDIQSSPSKDKILDGNIDLSKFIEKALFDITGKKYNLIMNSTPVGKVRKGFALKNNQFWKSESSDSLKVSGNEDGAAERDGTIFAYRDDLTHTQGKDGYRDINNILIVHCSGDGPGKLEKIVNMTFNKKYFNYENTKNASDSGILYNYLNNIVDFYHPYTEEMGKKDGKEKGVGLQNLYIKLKNSLPFLPESKSPFQANPLKANVAPDNNPGVFLDHSVINIPILINGEEKKQLFILNFGSITGMIGKGAIKNWKLTDDHILSKSKDEQGNSTASIQSELDKYTFQSFYEALEKKDGFEDLKDCMKKAKIINGDEDVEYNDEGKKSGLSKLTGTKIAETDKANVMDLLSDTKNIFNKKIKIYNKKIPEAVDPTPNFGKGKDSMDYATLFKEFGQVVLKGVNGDLARKYGQACGGFEIQEGCTYDPSVYYNWAKGRIEDGDIILGTELPGESENKNYEGTLSKDNYSFFQCFIDSTMKFDENNQIHTLSGGSKKMTKKYKSNSKRFKSIKKGGKRKLNRKKIQTYRRNTKNVNKRKKITKKHI